jgi:DNA-binding XRE family transcriptional regulator
MTSKETVTLTRSEYESLINRNADLEDRLAAIDADDGSRIPHTIALAIIRGESPLSAFRAHLGITLRELARQTGISASYISEIERGRKVGSVTALARIATALETTIDTLVIE